MQIEKAGFVKRPYNYRGWYAEMLGNADGKGSSWIFLRPRKEFAGDKRQLSFFDISLDGLYKQLEELYIEIDWIEDS